MVNFLRFEHNKGVNWPLKLLKILQYLLINLKFNLFHLFYISLFYEFSSLGKKLKQLGVVVSEENAGYLNLLSRFCVFPRHLFTYLIMEILFEMDYFQILIFSLFFLPLLPEIVWDRNGNGEVSGFALIVILDLEVELGFLAEVMEEDAIRHAY